MAVAALLTLVQTHATVIISEFMASNSGTLRDDFGDASDWIELHNTGDAPVNLQGWALTDRAGAASRWFFPSQVIEPDTYLVVFASGRNRKLPGAPLHTSFSLSAGGEYLALLRPNGTAATEFSPAFPRQVSDVSFGFPPTSTTTLVGPGATGQAGVPTSLEDFELNFAGWQTSTVPLPGSSWQEIQTGVGYDRTSEGVPYGSWIGPSGNIETRMRDLNESAFIRIPFLIDDTATVLSLRLRMRWDDGFIAYLNGLEVAAHNAPLNPTWNSGSTGDRLEYLNENWTDYPVSVGALRPGINLLAIHGLNWRVSSSDFLILPALEVTREQSGSAPAYFITPTPEAPNGEGDPFGPALTEPTSTLPRPLGQPSSPAHGVSVRINPTEFPLAPGSVRLAYRVMFDPEIQVTMWDDGVPPDTIAGDGIHAATLPTAALLPGQMLRWRFEAADTQGTVGRAPAYLDPADGDYYFGTVAVNPDEASSRLPVFHQFIENIAAADTLEGTRASFYYLDLFYDNVRIDLHGQSSLGFPKKGYNLDFNADNRFVWNLDAPRKLKDVDLLSNYADKSRLRNTLAHEVARRATTPYHFAFPIRVQRNGAFHGVMDLMEDGDDRMLERNGLDPDGALAGPCPQKTTE